VRENMMNKRRCLTLGFTLVEMLAVVAVAGLIIAAVGPMLFSTLNATKLTSAGDSIIGQISLARQLAVSRNRVIELRMYAYADAEAAGQEVEVKAVMLAEAVAEAGPAGGRGNAVALTEVFYLPSGVSIAKTTNLSPLFSSDTLQNDQERFILKASNATYSSIRFFPDGRTDITEPANNSYITLGDSRLISGAGAKVPDNFYAIQIDPVTGRPKAYRPGA
jgi:uncharacterized protein (TIGR02596 family)